MGYRRRRACPAESSQPAAGSESWPRCWLGSARCWRFANAAWRHPWRISVPPDFDPSFQVPNWGWWIVLYFFFGGVTGGVFFAAAWLDLFGDDLDRRAMRLGYLLAFPLVVLSAV